jgi:hypothetical protein
LDQPSKATRNPSCQLNDTSGAIDVPRRLAICGRGIFLSTAANFCRVNPAKCIGIMGENCLFARSKSRERCEAYFAMAAQSCRASARFQNLPFQRHDAQIVIARPRLASQSKSAGVRTGGLEPCPIRDSMAAWRGPAKSNIMRATLRTSLVKGALACPRLKAAN